VAQAKALVSKMTLDQKISQIHGVRTTGHFRETPGLPDAGVPDFNFTNGPAGLGPAGPGHDGHATALPAPIALAATWDRTTAHRYGEIMGKEAFDAANMMIEAPDINITRAPQGGRTFESYGEDPYLVGQLAVGCVEGIQSQGEIANVKHYAANNQETHRTSINEIIDERTLREIYLPAFEAAVREAQCGSIMGAYNKVNGLFCCENPFLLDEVLRKDWGFNGFVTCDFGALHNGLNSALAGDDYQSEGDSRYGAPLEAQVQSGALKESVVDTMLVRRFGQMYRFGLMAHPPTNRTLPAKEDGAIARQIGAEGIVLLKNDQGLLPLSAAHIRTVALIGPYATHASTGGRGSSEVGPLYTVTPLDGLQSALGSKVKVTLDDGTDPVRAAQLAKASDVAVVMVGDRNGEGADHGIVLSNVQDALVTAITAANPKTVVVLKTGSAVLMPWADQVPALVEAWYPGEEDGNAVADVLTGAVNPSGKLPITFPQSVTDTVANVPANFPGVDGTATYAEKVFVGYRYFDANQVKPLFPFGHGLSYTTFGFSKLAVTGEPSATGDVSVSFDVTNTGHRGGADVAQVYVGVPGSANLPEPPQQLKGFEKVTVQPGKSSHVTVTLNARAFAYWDDAAKGWAVTAGTFPIYVGDSSRNILLTGKATVPAAFAVPAAVCP
jgi:beta-glucosidase